MSPRTKEQYEEIRQKSRQVIMDAALELFAQQGYFGTSISQIAKLAKVSKGLLYNYFDNKEALLEAIVMQAVETGEQMLEALRREPGTAREKLWNMTEMSFQIVEGNLHYWKLITSLALQTDALESLMPILKKKQDMVLDLVSDWFEEMGETQPRETALFYGAVMDGVMLHYLQMKDYPVDRMKTYVLNQFFNKS